MSLESDNLENLDNIDSLDKSPVQSPDTDPDSSDPSQSTPKERPPVNFGRVTNRVYVGNLAWRTSWQDLKDHMRQCGEVVYADVFVDESGKSKGCGIVEYATRQQAVQAINTLNDSSIPGTERLIFVREDREDRFLRENRSQGRSYSSNFGGRGRGGGFRGGWQGRPAFHPPSQPHSHPQSRVGRQLFVTNLSYTTNWRDLKDYFRSCGNVIRADVLEDAYRNSKGQGIVLFETKDEAQTAIERLNNVEFQGRVLGVQEDKRVY